MTEQHVEKTTEKTTEQIDSTEPPEPQSGGQDNPAQTPEPNQAEPEDDGTDTT